MTPKKNIYIEIVELATGKVEKRMGPMTAAKAEKVKLGLLKRIRDTFFVTSGTMAALLKEAKDRGDIHMSTVARIEEKLHEIGVTFAYISMLAADGFTICDVGEVSFDTLAKISKAFKTTDINIGCDLGTASDRSHECEIHVKLKET